LTGSEVKQSAVLALQLVSKLLDNDFNPDSDRYVAALAKIDDTKYDMRAELFVFENLQRACLLTFSSSSFFFLS
jgi:hypothetical protein